MSKKVEHIIYSFPMTMGRKNTALDYTQWNDRSLAVFGKIIPMAPGLTADEIKRMGFLEAGTHFQQYPNSRR